MKKKYLTFLVFAMVIMIGTLNFSYRQSNSLSAEKKVSTLPVTSSVAYLQNPNQIIQEEVAVDEKRTINTEEISALKKSYPTKIQVDEDRELSPHTPSRSLMMFAKALGPLLEKAYENEDDANVLIDELQNCALDGEIHKAARALCVQNTEKITEHYPHLRTKIESLREEVPADVQKILETDDATRIK